MTMNAVASTPDRPVRAVSETTHVQASESEIFSKSDRGDHQLKADMSELRRSMLRLANAVRAARRPKLQG